MISGEPSQSSFHLVGLTVGVERPQTGGLGPVEGHDVQLSCAAARVDERHPVRVDGHRALDDVAGGEGRDDVLAGVVVHEVDRPVVGAEHHPRAPVALEHRGCPSSRCRTTPWSHAHGRLGAHAARGCPGSSTHLGIGRGRALAVVAAARAAPEGEQARCGEARLAARGTAASGVAVVVVVDSGAGRRESSSWALSSVSTKRCTPKAVAPTIRAKTISTPRRRRSCRGFKWAGRLCWRRGGWPIGVAGGAWGGRVAGRAGRPRTGAGSGRRRPARSVGAQRSPRIVVGVIAVGLRVVGLAGAPVAASLRAVGIGPIIPPVKAATYGLVDPQAVALSAALPQRDPGLPQLKLCAPAGALSVGVVDGEARALEPVFVVERGAFEQHGTGRVDDDLHARCRPSYRLPPRRCRRTSRS